MNQLIIVIVIAILFILCGILFYFLYRMNIYLSSLEERLAYQITLTENLKQSMKEIIAEEFLQNDGRLKKFQIQSERHVIFNGVQVQDEFIEL
jgi:cell division protein FtsX